MTTNLTNQTLALAGIFQAASLVDQLARTGQIEPDDLEIIIRSILNLNPTSFEDVFHGKRNLAKGLKVLQESLAKNGLGVSREVLQYSMGIIAVQAKLQKQPELMDKLSSALDRTVEQQHYFDSFTHESVISSTAQCYENSISKLKFRIKVTGNPAHLQNPKVAEKIRAILLFGVRSALLWRQSGGHRWHFLLYRQQLKQRAVELQGMA